MGWGGSIIAHNKQEIAYLGLTSNFRGLQVIAFGPSIVPRQVTLNTGKCIHFGLHGVH